MEKDGDAVVTPVLPWALDGIADVAPLPPFSQVVPRTLPLRHFAAGAFTVPKSDYSRGLVCIPEGGGPDTSPATLPIFASSGDSYQVAEEGFTEWPDGLVVWFS